MSEADCTICCKLSHCPADHKPQAKIANSNVTVESDAILAANLPPAYSSLPMPREVVSVHIESFFANAPPGVRSGRAPPFA